MFLNLKSINLILIACVILIFIIYYQFILNSNYLAVKNLNQLIEEYDKAANYTELLALLKSSNIKSIQVYTNYYGWAWKHVGFGHKAFQDCPKEKRCYSFKLPGSMGQQALEKSDGVLVHLPNLVQLPSKTYYKRRSDQLWLFYTHESPRFSYCLRNYKLTDLDDWFNLTCTVRTEHWLYPYDLNRLDAYQVFYDEFNKKYFTAIFFYKICILMLDTFISDVIL